MKIADDQLLQVGVQPVLDGGDVGSSEWRGRLYSRLLHRAVSAGSADAVSSLLEQGSRLVINSRDEVGLTPLHRAVLSIRGRGREAIVRMLCKHGVDLEATFEGLRPLHMAAGRGHAAVLQALLEEGADIDATTIEGFTALHCAAGKGGLSALTILLQAGADANTRSTGPEKRTPLHAAAVMGLSENVDELLLYGADVNIGDADLTTGLHVACARGNLEVARCLIDAGADVSARNVDGDTPLHYACMSLEYRVVELLLSREANDMAANGSKNTPTDMLRQNIEDQSRDTKNPTLVEMIRAMLTKAPADRSWRRRRCMVMTRAVILTRQAVEGREHESNVSLFTARVETTTKGTQATGECDQHRKREGVERMPVGSGGEISSKEARYSSLVWAVEVQEEGIFRRIVGFM